MNVSDIDMEAIAEITFDAKIRQLKFIFGIY